MSTKRPRMWFDGDRWTRRTPSNNYELGRYKASVGEDWNPPKKETPVLTKTEESATTTGTGAIDFSKRAFGAKVVQEFKPRYLGLYPYPACCGAQIITGFYASDGQVDTDLKGIIEDAKGKKAGMLMAILNGQQKDFLDNVLTKHGFTMTCQSTNPNHMNTTTIYLYIKLVGRDTKHTTSVKA